VEGSLDMSLTIKPAACEENGRRLQQRKSTRARHSTFTI
jgi:hypothetical protein